MTIPLPITGFMKSALVGAHTLPRGSANPGLHESGNGQGTQKHGIVRHLFK